MLLDRIKNLIKEKYPKEYLSDFEFLRLRAINVDKSLKVVTYTISAPVELVKETENKLLTYIKEFSPVGFKILLDFKLDKMDAEIAKRMLWDFLNGSCPSAYMELFPCKENVLIENKSDRVIITFNVTKKVKDLLQNGTLEKIENHFKTFTSHKLDFFVNEIPSEEVDLKETLIHLDKERERRVDAYVSQPERKIYLEEQKALIGKLPTNSPQYIVDIVSSQSEVFVCGTFGNFSRRESKNKEMTICKFTLQDFSGSINVIYFSRNEKNLSLLLNIYAGDQIVVRGKPQINTYDGKLELLANAIGICKISNQQRNLDVFKPIPPEYLKISPMPFERGRQTDVFNEKLKIPNSLKGKSFVVFDLETTGLQPQMDRIIEIGALKIKDGQIIETFTTLVNPQTNVPQKIVELTGITNDILKDNPIFAEVCGDFYKFAHDSYLIAHNISFDYSFLDYYARPCGYLFDNSLIDTIVLAKKFFEDKPSKSRPKDNKLETLAKYFQFEAGDFHRAMFDTLITAKLFLRLLSLDESLLDKI